MEHKLAISHAGGIAAEAILEKIAATGLPADRMVLLDDDSRVGAKLAYDGHFLGILNQYDFNYANCDLLLLTQADAELEQRALSAGCLLVSHAIENDMSPLFFGSEQHGDINFGDTHLRLAGPELSCLLPVLTVLDRAQAIAQLNMTFLRSAEFFGKAGVDELATQTVNLLNAKDARPGVFPQQIAFNVLTSAADPGIRRDLGYFLRNSNCSLGQQTVDVPLFHGFVAALQIRFDDEVNLEDCMSLLTGIDNVTVKMDTISPISDCNQSFNCVISHLEQAPNEPSSLQFWLIADPMRYGLANNYVNIVDFLLKSFL